LTDEYAIDIRYKRVLFGSDTAAYTLPSYTRRNLKVLAEELGGFEESNSYTRLRDGFKAVYIFADLADAYSFRDSTLEHYGPNISAKLQPSVSTTRKSQL